MIYILITLFSTLLFMDCDSKTKAPLGSAKMYEVPVGIGLIDINVPAGMTLELYANAVDNIPTKKIKFKRTANGTYEFTTLVDLKPYKWFEGDSYVEGETHERRGLVAFLPELKLRVIDSVKVAFWVLVNEKPGEAYWVKRDKDCIREYKDSMKEYPEMENSQHIFRIWVYYIKHAVFIDKQNIVLYDKPCGKKVYEDKDRNCPVLTAIEVKDDWIKVAPPLLHSFSETDRKCYTGWMPWKAGNKIVIDIVEKAYK